jgi:hypothetical protein
MKHHISSSICWQFRLTFQGINCNVIMNFNRREIIGSCETFFYPLLSAAQVCFRILKKAYSSLDHGIFELFLKNVAISFVACLCD